MSKWSHLQNRRDISTHSWSQFKAEEMGTRGTGKDHKFHQLQATGHHLALPLHPAQVWHTSRALSRLSTTRYLHFNKQRELLQSDLLNSNNQNCTRRGLRVTGAEDGLRLELLFLSFTLVKILLNTPRQDMCP